MVLITALVWGLYFLGYQTPAHHVPLAAALTEPSAVLLHGLVYLGSPLGHVAMWWPASRRVAVAVAAVAGAVLLLAVAPRILALLRRRPASAADAFLASLWLFLLCSAAVTSLSRSFLGIEQALSSRYTTPALLAWLGLLLSLRLPSVLAVPQRARLVGLGLAAGLAGSLLALALVQARAVWWTKPPGSDRLALLAMAMQVPDHEVIGRIHPRPEAGLAQVANFRRLALGPWAWPELALAHHRLGQHGAAPRTSGACAAELQSLARVPAAQKLRRVEVDMTGEAFGREWRQLDVRAGDGRVLGLLVATAAARPPSTLPGTRYTGYVVAQEASMEPTPDAAQRTLWLVSTRSPCATVPLTGL
jgi:hypothetical protein